MSVFATEQLVIVIPARYASTRLPGKPLADIQGRPMIQHVYERAMQVPHVHAVLVATDDERVADAVHGFGGRCLMTSPDHASGTDRLTEVMLQIDASIYINLQGDEPLVRPADITKLAEGMMIDPQIKVGTLYHPISAREAINPNTVKLVLAANGDALYFSRSLIPYLRDSNAGVRYLKHIGIYAYRREVLAAYAAMPQPMIEHAEKLEQLRLLSAGIPIRAFEVEPTAPAVDTSECLEHVRGLVAGGEPELKPTLAGIKLVITDVDGVLTDGGIYYNESGECLKRFHVRDGLGIRLLEENGIRVAVLSGRDSATLRKRLVDLGVSLHQFGVKDKAAACRALMTQAAVKSIETAYIGDDSIDLPAFQVCGLSFAVANAPEYIKSCAYKSLSTRGGEGALRELADAILLAQGKGNIFGTAEGYASVMSKMAQ